MKTPGLHAQCCKTTKTHYQRTACEQLYDFTYLKYSSRKKLAEANPYLEIWGFPFLKFSLIVLTSYLAFTYLQFYYVAYLTWLLHNKRLAGPAEEIWQHFSEYLTTLFISATHIVPTHLCNSFQSPLKYKTESTSVCLNEQHFTWQLMAKNWIL